MPLIRLSFLLIVLSTAGCYAQDYQGYYSPYGVQPYTASPAMPVYPSYQEPIYGVPRYNTPPFAYDQSYVPYRGNYYGGTDQGYGRREFEERREQHERREFRQEQQLQQRETQQRQELYNSHVRDLQTQHNQGVVGLQQQFNQGRINRDQLNNGYRQLEQHMNGGIANEQRALPR